MTQNHTQNISQQNAQIARSVWAVAVLAMLVALILIAIKAGAWWLTGSVALLGALLDSALDFSISGMNFFAIRHAQSPADREHRFGHGKAEALAALVQGAAITIAALGLLYASAQAALNPAPLEHSNIGVAVMVVSILLTLGLVLVQRRVAKKSGSIAIAADSAHYASDVFMNLGVIAALILSAPPFGFIYADALCGAIVAGILAKGSWGILTNAVAQLMDAEMADEERARIKEIVRSHPEVRGIHDLRTRRAGLDCFIQCHIELDGAISLRAAHEISDAVEAMLMRAFPNAEVLIHQDPEGLEDISHLQRS